MCQYGRALASFQHMTNINSAQSSFTSPECSDPRNQHVLDSYEAMPANLQYHNDITRLIHSHYLGLTAVLQSQRNIVGEL